MKTHSSSAKRKGFTMLEILLVVAALARTGTGILTYQSHPEQRKNIRKHRLLS